MKNWLLINDFGDEYLINLHKVTSISMKKNCTEEYYLFFTLDNSSPDFQFCNWSFSSNKECENKYKELIEQLTMENK